MGARGRTPELAQKMSAQMQPKETPKRVPPATLGLLGQELWKSIVAQYPEDYFLAGDWPLLHAYCAEWDRHERAQAQLLAQGEVIETNTGSVKKNPWCDVLVASTAALGMLAVKLRLSVNSREKNSKASVQGKRPSETASARSGLMFGVDTPEAVQ